MTPHGMWIHEPHNTCVMKESISSTIKHMKASNTTHQIVGQGKVAIKLLDWKVRQIPNVLHVPGLKQNLFFTIQFDKFGRKISIKSKVCILNNLISEMIVECRLKSYLYKLGETIRPIKDAIVVLVNASLHTVDLWHFQLSHINKRRLKNIQNISIGVDTFN